MFFPKKIKWKIYSYTIWNWMFPPNIFLSSNREATFSLCVSEILFHASCWILSEFLSEKRFPCYFCIVSGYCFSTWNIWFVINNWLNILHCFGLTHITSLVGSKVSNDSDFLLSVKWLCWIEIFLWSSIDSMGRYYINSGCWMVQRYIRILVAKLSVMIMFL